MAAAVLADIDPARRFGGIARLYGEGALGRLSAAHVCVVGIGGVGSWTAEALARSGVGRLTLIDLDHVAESNINRQAHALEGTLGQAKVVAMAGRLKAIHPGMRVDMVEDFVTPENAAGLLRDFDFVVDAIDDVRAKVAIVLGCRARGIPLTLTGGAGGKTDPCAVRVEDLARTVQDPLLARLRSLLRKEYGFPREPRKRFGVEAVYVDQPLSRPPAACGPGRGPQGLACAGYGSSMMMTATVGLAAAARAVERLLAQPAGGKEG
ncbi:tRNA threonylcarbamoyladenosine dehydratase [Pseudothauera nasutitermitis]|uniref:tRNA threonylcarbamoyladenosine dehydratase n=1 Tax=Pseudothauera nasutitermitis TaxID=2565930 RepID=A0A4S4AVA7_9RHOO|nr:tRNA threonylcarbamoyladenosine dehydratase [Pseudothauera nasutitermitis]THF63868.1 tRNA threonylcarbamoyladenosine dehydratase [Pseudothauera nasutitermitis]